MIFPGLKKLGNELGFKHNDKFIYGMLKNSYVMFADGPNQKNVYFRFPVIPDENDIAFIKGWCKKGYAKTVEIYEEDTFNCKFNFMEYIVPYKISKIKEVIESVTGYIFEKYPDAKMKCASDGCNHDSAVEIYDVDGRPVPLCESCAKSIEQKMEIANQEFEQQENNYVSGTLGAVLFSIPGILVSVFFFLLGAISAIASLVYSFLAKKGYVWAKGKYNKVGVIIITFVTVLYTVLGTLVGYSSILVKEMLKYDAYKGLPLGDFISYLIDLFKVPEIIREFHANVYIALVISVVFLVVNTIQSFKETKKANIKKN